MVLSPYWACVEGQTCTSCFVTFQKDMELQTMQGSYYKKNLQSSLVLWLLSPKCIPKGYEKDQDRWFKRLFTSSFEMCVLLAFVTKHYFILLLSLSGFLSEVNFFFLLKAPPFRITNGSGNHHFLSCTWAFFKHSKDLSLA